MCVAAPGALVDDGSEVNKKAKLSLKDHRKLVTILMPTSIKNGNKWEQSGDQQNLTEGA
jgi:hypothetical protein